MNEALLNKVAKEVEAAIKKIAKKHNLNVSRGNVRYTDSNMKFSNLVFSDQTSDGLDAGAVEEFKQYCGLYNIKTSALNVFFKVSKNEKLKIVGFKNRNRVDKFILEDQNGKSFKASASYVKSAMLTEAYIS